MSNRPRKVQRCFRCRMHAPLCICADTPHLDLRTRLVLVMHYREIRKTTSTAVLALNTLTHSEVRLRGKKNLPLELDNLNDPQRRLLLLYPDPSAAILSPSFVEQDPRPVTLLVPDGTWRQVARMRSDLLVLPFAETVQLPPGPPSEWTLRKAEYTHHLSTFEAIARAYGLLESPHVQTQLETIFRLMVTRTRQTRGLAASE